MTSANGYEPDAYDNLGNLVPGAPRLQEQSGYAYDAAGNLQARTNNALTRTFTVNNLNELTGGSQSGTLTVAGNTTELSDAPPFYRHYPVGVTNVTVWGTGLTSGPASLYFDGTWARSNAAPVTGLNTYTAVAQDDYGRAATNTVSVTLPATSGYNYDLNGNLLADGVRNFAYDDENRLTSVWATNAWRCDFAYDGIAALNNQPHGSFHCFFNSPSAIASRASGLGWCL